MPATPCSWVESPTARASMAHPIPSPPSVHQDAAATLRKPALSSRPMSEPIQMSSGGAEKVSVALPARNALSRVPAITLPLTILHCAPCTQRQCSRPGPPKPASSFSSLNWKAAGSSFSRCASWPEYPSQPGSPVVARAVVSSRRLRSWCRESDEIEQGEDEIRSILQVRVIPALLIIPGHSQLTRHAWFHRSFERRCGPLGCSCHGGRPLPELWSWV